MSKKIRYIGRAKTKSDNVMQSGAKWPHPGAVTIVTDEVAARLLNYPTVFVEEGAENDPGPDAVYRVNGIAGAFSYITADGEPVAEEKAKPEAIVDNTKVKAVEGATKFGYSQNKDEAIRQAIKQLQRGNSEHFTDAGLPRVEAIGEKLGYQVGAADRTRIWEDMQSDEPLTPADAIGEVPQAQVVV